MLASYEGAVVVVSHDRTFLDRHATRIAELALGQMKVYNGNYTAYLAQKAAADEVSLSRRANLERQITHARRFVERFGAKDSKATQAESRKKKIAKLEAERNALHVSSDSRGLRFRFRPASRSGDIVLRLENVAKAYGETTVYTSLDLELRRGEHVALVGPNGAGKSTLLRIGAGALDFDAGSRELGHNVEPGFYAQHQLEALDPKRTALEEVEQAATLDEIPRLRSLLGTFLFSGDDVHKKVSVLSGGEKARVALAKLLLGNANFLILDEPTNHLDMQAREVLCEALRGFAGTLLFISHDRALINALATKVLEVTPGGDDGGARLRVFTGGYDDYARRIEAESQAEAQTEAAAKPRAAKARRPTVTAEQRSRRKRLRELRDRVADAERVIETAEQEVERLAWLSADPGLARNGERMRELELDRRAERARLDEQYGEWERLSAEIEALDQLDEDS